ncbi:MAG: hypothetical protein JW723_05970 [Bacteroidales bacterium]|nr:hypothetical protein [Bacteroidales bacterium]
MTIDIQKTVYRKKLRSFYSTLFFLVVIGALLVTNIYYGEVAGVDKYELSIILACIYILSILYSTIRNYQYIFYSDEGDKIILRFFSFSFFARKKSSIEIRKTDLAGYQINRHFFSLRENLILYQKTKKGTAKYPPVSITALSGSEKKGMLHSLSIFAKEFSEKPQNKL